VELVYALLLLSEVEIAEWTSDGKMRVSSFVGLRDDKDPKEALREN
jgi:bifunctional non-homologous end joining protein LigD